MAGVPLAIGTILPAGSDTPPTTTAKAYAVAIYNGIVALLAGLSQVIPDLSDQARVWIAVAGLVLSAVGSPIVALLKANQLEQAVQIIDPPGKHAVPEDV
jgi:uncharacterized membrane protein HdeD (DUF308 family)